MDGTMNWEAGFHAEECVALRYERAGLQIAARRWRGRAGEIDMIARDGNELVFVEVKRARTHARAAERVSARQMARIMNAATEFVEGEPAGQLTPMRFDVAMVDGLGRIEVLENAFAA